MNRQELKEKAIFLRQSGHSYSYISKVVGISKSTLSNWLWAIPYRPNKETLLRIGKARVQASLRKHEQKRDSFKTAKIEAKKEIMSITKRDLFMLGLGLYWGEGTKGNNLVRVVNADPRIIKLSIRWFKEICGLNEPNFVIRLHLYPDNNIYESIRFWSKQTGLSEEQFQKSQIDKRIKTSISKRGKLPHGTAHMTIKSKGNKRFGVFLGRKINAWIDEVGK